MHLSFKSMTICNYSVQNSYDNFLPAGMKKFKMRHLDY